MTPAAASAAITAEDAFDIDEVELALLPLLLDACDEGEEGAHSSSSLSMAAAAAVAAAPAFFSCLGLAVPVVDDDFLSAVVVVVVVDWQVIRVHSRKLPCIKYCARQYNRKKRWLERGINGIKLCHHFISITCGDTSLSYLVIIGPHLRTTRHPNKSPSIQFTRKAGKFTLLEEFGQYLLSEASFL